MVSTEETLRRLAEIPQVSFSTNTLLSQYTRFGIGGPADVLAQTDSVESFLQSLEVARESGRDYVVIGGGTNLVVADQGFRGIVLRFTGRRILAEDSYAVADAGVALQELVDFSIERGLKGLETLTGIPGSVGAAVYGNAGAYGHSISERVSSVRFFDGLRISVYTNEQCEFEYRESVFKRRKDWVIFSAKLLLEPADAAELRNKAAEILKIRNEKYPVTMKCAGSIFKNLLLAELPDSVARQVPKSVVREGKVPSAYFLEQVGAKGAQLGDIHVASYHANLIYNAGQGTASDLSALITNLKNRVRDRFGLELEEEVQYLGFGTDGSNTAPKH